MYSEWPASAWRAVVMAEKIGSSSTKVSTAKHAFVLVLREAMASDDQSPSGVYFGTDHGHVYYTRKRRR